MKKKNTSKVETRLLSDPRYRGKHIVMIGGKIFAVTTGQQAAKVFDRVTKKYPKEIPTLAYIPKEDTLILIS